MVPDDFPSMDLPNTYHTPRPKEAFGSPADLPMGSDEAEPDRQMTMQLRLQLQVQNTGEYTLQNVSPCTIKIWCVRHGVGSGGSV